MRRFLHIVDEIGLGWFAAAIAATVLLFGIGYWQLAQHGQLLYTYDSSKTPGFLDSLYFSVVTISSLGYGDIRPLGYARLLVAAEVLIGLSFLGLLVAKVSSVKQDYILKRLYGEAVDEKLAALVKHLEEQRALYRTTAALLMDGEIDPELTTTFRRDTPGATFFTRLSPAARRPDRPDGVRGEQPRALRRGGRQPHRGRLRRRARRAPAHDAAVGAGPRARVRADLRAATAPRSRTSATWPRRSRGSVSASRATPTSSAICEAMLGLCRAIRARCCRESEVERRYPSKSSSG